MLIIYNLFDNVFWYEIVASHGAALSTNVAPKLIWASEEVFTWNNVSQNDSDFKTAICLLNPVEYWETYIIVRGKLCWRLRNLLNL